MPVHASILAWRIPWTEAPGRLQSLGLQRTREDRATNTSLQPFLGCREAEICLSDPPLWKAVTKIPWLRMVEILKLRSAPWAWALCEPGNSPVRVGIPMWTWGPVSGWRSRACLGAFAPAGPSHLPNCIHAHSKLGGKFYQSTIFIPPIFTFISEQSWMRNKVKSSQAQGMNPLKGGRPVFLRDVVCGLSPYRLWALLS